MLRISHLRQCLRPLLLLTVLASLFYSNWAFSLTCQRLAAPSYVFECQYKQCKAGFIVVERGFYQGCKSRSFVEEMDPPLATFLIPVVQAAVPANKSGVYAIRLGSNNSDSLSFQVVRDQLEENLDSYVVARPGVQPLSSVELSQRIAQYRGSDWLVQEPAATLLLARQDAERQARNDRHRWLADMVFEWSCFLLALMILIQLRRVFYERLHHREPPAKSFWPPLLLQMLIGLGLLVIVWGNSYALPPVVLLLPVVMVLLLLQLWDYCSIDDV